MLSNNSGDRVSCTSSKVTTTNPLPLASPSSPASPTAQKRIQERRKQVTNVTATSNNLESKLESILGQELGIKNNIKLVTATEKNDDTNKQGEKIYNSILIIDVEPSKYRSRYIKHEYGCLDCDYRSWIYDDIFRHICRNHFQIYIEQDYLGNADYVEALRFLDEYASVIWHMPSFTTFALQIASETFNKYNSRNQRYFKKLLP